MNEHSRTFWNPQIVITSLLTSFLIYLIFPPVIERVFFYVPNMFCLSAQCLPFPFSCCLPFTQLLYFKYYNSVVSSHFHIQEQLGIYLCKVSYF